MGPGRRVYSRLIPAVFAGVVTRPSCNAQCNARLGSATLTSLFSFLGLATTPAANGRSAQRFRIYRFLLDQARSFGRTGV
jgi:hypothetical protein